MERTLRLLGFAGAIGAVAILFAQSARSPGSAQNPGTSSGSAVASATSSSRPANSVLTLMSMYFCRLQDLEIYRSESAGRKDLVQPVIQACCAANLTLLTPDQQKPHIASWEIEKYAPNTPGWGAVSQTPSLVNHLLKLDPEVDKKVEKLIEDVWAPLTTEQQKLDRQIMATEEWKSAKTKHEQNIVHYNWMQAYRAKNPLPPKHVMIARDIAEYDSALQQTRALLTKEQVREMDGISSRYLNALKTATASRNSRT